MGYDKETYAAAQEVLDRRRRRAEMTAEAHKEEAFEKIPELLDIQYEIAGYGADVIGAVSKGDGSRAYVEDLAGKSLAAQERRKKLLTDNGFPADYLQPAYSCKLCGDTGMTDEGVCDCLKELLYGKALDEIRKHAPVDESGFDNFILDYYPESSPSGQEPRRRMKMILDYCRNYAEDFDKDSPSVYMHGPTGLGKTHLSLAIAKAAVKKGCNVIYASAPSLFSTLEKERFNRQTATDGRTEEKIEEADLVIIDDLGAEFSTQFTVSCVYNIINSRLLSKKPTIINTNLTPQELEDKYSQRITSRITGNYVSLMFFGRDIRQIKRNKESQA